MWCCGAIISHPVFRENSVKVTREQGAGGVGCVVGDRAGQEREDLRAAPVSLLFTHSDGVAVGDAVGARA